MSNGRVEYTFLWLIDNYSYCWHKNGERLESPIFTADELEGRTWSLFLYPRGYKPEDKGYVSVYIGRGGGDDEPEMFSVEYELSIVATNGGSRLCTGKQELNKSQMLGVPKFLELNVIRLRRKDFLPDDTMKVLCKLRKGEGKINKVVPISARTRIAIERISFFHPVEEFHLFQLNQRKNTAIVHSSSKKGCIIGSSNVYCSERNIIVEITPSNRSYSLCKLKCFLFHVSGNLIECGEDENRMDEERRDIQKLTLTLSKQDVVAKKDVYLPDERLNLLCECTFATGLEFEKIEETPKETPKEDVGIPFSRPKQNQPTQQGVKSYITGRGRSGRGRQLGKFQNPLLYSRALDSNNSNKIVEIESGVKNHSVFPSALEDIKALYIDKCLTDVELKTESKSFPAHKIVLAARSPIFKAMMTSDMREKNNNRIQIDDLADNIVEQLLLFLYSDRVENLQWTTSIQLYYAADKYQIGKLKELCSSFLVENMTTSNVSELLVLSDRHNDAELKKNVEDFILQHEDQVFGSKEWEKLIETDPQLVIKTMHLKYKRKSEQN